MPIHLRRGVFETNSSSSHTLTWSLDTKNRRPYIKSPVFQTDDDGRIHLRADYVDEYEDIVDPFSKACFLAGMLGYAWGFHDMTSNNPITTLKQVVAMLADTSVDKVIISPQEYRYDTSIYGTVPTAFYAMFCFIVDPSVKPLAEFHEY